MLVGKIIAEPCWNYWKISRRAGCLGEAPPGAAQNPISLQHADTRSDRVLRIKPPHSSIAIRACGRKRIPNTAPEPFRWGVNAGKILGAHEPGISQEL